MSTVQKPWAHTRLIESYFHHCSFRLARLWTVFWTFLYYLDIFYFNIVTILYPFSFNYKLGEITFWFVFPLTYIQVKPNFLFCIVWISKCTYQTWLHSLRSSFPIWWYIEITWGNIRFLKLTKTKEKQFLRVELGNSIFHFMFFFFFLQPGMQLQGTATVEHHHNKDPGFKPSFTCRTRIKRLSP